MNVRTDFGFAMEEVGRYDVYKPQPLSLALRDGARSEYRPGDAVAEAFAGCGLAGLAVAATKPDHAVTICDIWPDAIEAARLIARNRGLAARFEICDVYGALPPRALDMLIAAPPAVPTPEPGFWRLSRGMEIATNGGSHGTDLMLRAVKEAPDRLREQGRLIIAVPHWCDYRTIFDALETNFESVETISTVRNELVVCQSADDASLRVQLEHLYSMRDAGLIEISIDPDRRITSTVSIVRAQA